MPESRETVFRPASGGGLPMVIDVSKLDSFVQVLITKRSSSISTPDAFGDRLMCASPG